MLGGNRQNPHSCTPLQRTHYTNLRCHWLAVRQSQCHRKPVPGLLEAYQTSFSRSSCGATRGGLAFCNRARPCMRFCRTSARTAPMVTLHKACVVSESGELCNVTKRLRRRRFRWRQSVLELIRLSNPKCPSAQQTRILVWGGRPDEPVRRRLPTKKRMELLSCRLLAGLSFLFPICHPTPS
jgi:hypothetical protein